MECTLRPGNGQPAGDARQGLLGFVPLPNLRKIYLRTTIAHNPRHPRAGGDPGGHYAGEV